MGLMSSLRSLFVGKTTDQIIKMQEWGGKNKEDVLKEFEVFAASGKSEDEIKAWGLDRKLSYAEISVLTASVIIVPEPSPPTIEPAAKNESEPAPEPIQEKKKRGPAKGSTKKVSPSKQTKPQTRKKK